MLSGGSPAADRDCFVRERQRLLAIA
jgi:hypothetical protein